MVLQDVGEIEESRDKHRKQSGEDDSGHDENDELVLVRKTANMDSMDEEDESDQDSDVEMYSSDGDE